MIVQQVDHEIFADDFDRVLLADERKADAQFDQELPDVSDQPRFGFSLVSSVGDRQKVVVVGILEQLLREVRLRRGGACVESW